MIDDVEVAIGDRIHITNHSAWYRRAWRRIRRWFGRDDSHGIYVVTDMGAAGKPWVIERNDDV